MQLQERKWSSVAPPNIEVSQSSWLPWLQEVQAPARCKITTQFSHSAKEKPKGCQT